MNTAHHQPKLRIENSIDGSVVKWPELREMLVETCSTILAKRLEFTAIAGGL